MKRTRRFPPLEETLPLAEWDDILELDELWSFIGCKARVRWLWVALCRRTRQVVGYVFGDRSAATCRQLWEKIPEDHRLALCYSDFWEAYRNVVPEEQHEPVGKESRVLDERNTITKFIVDARGENRCRVTIITEWTSHGFQAWAERLFVIPKLRKIYRTELGNLTEYAERRASESARKSFGLPSW